MYLFDQLNSDLPGRESIDFHHLISGIGRVVLYFAAGPFELLPFSDFFGGRVMPPFEEMD